MKIKLKEIMHNLHNSLYYYYSQLRRTSFSAYFQEKKNKKAES